MSLTNTNRTGGLTSARSPILTNERRLRQDFSSNEDNLDFEVEEITSKTPLMSNSNTTRPILATPENDEIDDKDNTNVLTRPYREVDDELPNKRVPPMENHVENASEVPSRLPDLKPGNGSTNENNRTDIPINELPRDADAPDGVSYRGGSRRPSFPTENDFALHDHVGHHHDLEVGSTFGLESVDLNVYQHKKTLAQGMMDLALFSANANQLRYVLESANRHPYYYPSLIFIVFSLVLQVAIGIGLIWNATYNVKDEKEVCFANRINNFTVVGIFLVTVVNVFISAFGVADQPTIVVTSNTT